MTSLTTTVPHKDSKSSVSIALTCTTHRRISATASANQGSKKGDSTGGYPGEHNETLLKGSVQFRGTCSPLSGLHVLIAIQTLLKPSASVRLDNLVWFGTAGIDVEPDRDRPASRHCLSVPRAHGHTHVGE